MKKLSKILVCGLGFLPLCFTHQVKAEEEIKEPEQQEIIDTNQDGEISEDELVDKIKAKLGEYLDVNTIANIITWLSTSGVLAFALGLLNKVRKYKDYKTGDLIKEFETKITEKFKEEFEKLDANEINKITGAIGDLQKAQETIMKVLVLMQDNTAKGKVALIEYLGAKTDNTEVKEAVEQVATELVAKEQAVEEAKEVLNQDYKDIF